MANNKNHRDEFSQSVKDKIAKCAGYICSFPGCKRMTICGSEDRRSGVSVTGIAAHITAASPGGPRFDPNMTPEERTSESNGIWLCQIHAKLIDDNPSKYTADDLRRWKIQHENWVFKRVESGKEIYREGVIGVSFKKIGVFSDEYTLYLGRHNLLVSPNSEGITTLCQIIGAFSGGEHWKEFNKRFAFNKCSRKQSYIKIIYKVKDQKNYIKIVPQEEISKKKKKRQYLLIEHNGCLAFDWPRSLFKILIFRNQLYMTKHTDPKDTFIKAIRYLAKVFNTSEDLIWDSLRRDLTTSTLLGYTFHRTGYRKVDVLVPDGRDFYLPHTGISFTELHSAFLDIAMKLVHCTPKHMPFLLVFDSEFFEKFDSKNKELIFTKIIEKSENNIQTLFCLRSDRDAEILKKIRADKWVNATTIRGMTIHAFL